VTKPTPKKPQKRLSTKSLESPAAQRRPQRRSVFRKEMKLNSTSCSDDTKEILSSAIQGLGSSRLGKDYEMQHVSRLVQELEPCTHLIMEQSTRTLKVLFALARGAWVLSPSWVLTSLENGKWVDEEPFETKAFTGASKSRRSREDGAGGLLENAGAWLQNLRPEIKNIADNGYHVLQIYVSENNTPSQEILTNLIQTAGGKVISNFESSDVCIAPKSWKPAENKELNNEQEDKEEKKSSKKKKGSSKSPKKKRLKKGDQNDYRSSCNNSGMVV